ncbi:MAG: AAA family ATPase [Acidobacteria bacterium]|nr:AAA family ATPase [Acidobacteriota bacterium]
MAEQWNIDTVLAKRGDILEFAGTLKKWFVGKDEEVDMMVLAAVAGEPLLFVGEPGTAKSDMVVKFVRLLGLYEREGDFFEYMLTRFTEPSEIIGPVDILRLKNEGEFIRNTEGKLPEARVVFLDEVFKANSAILNVLLTIINEKKFYQGGRPRPVPLELLFAATNSVSVEEELKALKDRFTLKIKTEPVQEQRFLELIRRGLANEGSTVKPVDFLHFEDFLAVRAYLKSCWTNATADMAAFAPSRILDLVIKTLAVFKNDLNVFISDRKVIKIYKLLRAHAFLFGDGTLGTENLAVLKYIGEEDEDFDRLRTAVDDILVRN